MWSVGSLTAAALIFGSCGGSPIRPSDGRGPLPLLPPSPFGEVTLNDVTPNSGSTLRLRDCGPSGLCSDQLKTTFEVLVRSDIPDALLVVSLSAGERCAGTWLPTTLTAGNRASFSSSSVRMALDEEGRLLCRLPIETTRLVFEVRRSSTGAPLLHQEFAYRYTLEEERPE